MGYFLSLAYYSRTKQWNDYQMNDEKKYRHQRVNKYQTSWRKSAPKQKIGTANVRKKLASHLLSLYASMMHDLHARNWQNALNKLQASIERDEDAKNVVLYTVAIRCCCVSGKISEATNLYKQMYDDNNIKPDEITLIAMLKGCSVIRDWDESQYWLHKIMIDGNINKNDLKLSAYSLMISSANQFTWDKAWDLFTKLTNDRDIELDIIIYNAMLDVFARAKQSKLCQELFIKIRNDDKLKTTMDVHTFESVIRSCVSDGNIKSALNYVQLMQSEEFKYKVTKQMISDILRTLKYYKGESDGFLLAKTLWNQVIGNRIYPDAVIFGIMIDLCCKYNAFEYGLQLFRDMVTIYKINPTTIVFNNLLKCCVVESKSKEYILKLLNDMKQVYNLCPDQYTYNIILNAMIKLTRKQLEDDRLSMKDKYLIITELLTFWNDKMSLKNKVSYSTIIHALFNLNMDYFDNTRDNIINKQMLALYEIGCNNGYLGHWSTEQVPRMDINPYDCWILEMHGWSTNVTSVSLQYFFERELPNMLKESGMDALKHLLISVGKGHHSEDHIPVIKDSALKFIRDSIGIENIKPVSNNSGCLYIDKYDLKSCLQSS